MNNSPLQLKHFWFTHVEVKVHPHHDSPNTNEEVAAELKIASEVGNNKTNPLIWVVRLRVEVLPPINTPPKFTTTVEALGEFTVDPSWPKDRRQRLVSVNGASMVYSAIREMVSNITARSPIGTFTLPTQSFVPDSANSAPQKQP